MKKLISNAVFLLFTLIIYSQNNIECETNVKFMYKYMSKAYPQRLKYADLNKDYTGKQLVLIRTDLEMLSGCRYYNLDTLNDYLNIFNDSLSFEVFKNCLKKHANKRDSFNIVKNSIVLDTSKLFKDCEDLNILHSYVLLNKYERLIWYCLYSSAISPNLRSLILRDLKSIYRKKRLMRVLEKYWNPN